MNTKIYYVVQEDVKLHYCGSYFLAQLVTSNLERRYGKSCVIGQDNNRKFHMDYGSTVSKYEKVGTLPEDLELFVPINAKDTFLKDVKEMKLYDGEFYKLHGYLNVLCLTKEQGDWLKSAV